MIPFTSTASSTLRSPEGTYHYSFARLGSQLAVISSDDCLRIIDPSNFSMVAISETSHGDGVTCINAVDENLVFTAGRDGTARLWDLRNGLADSVRTFKKKRDPILSLDSCGNRGLVAVGTELTGQNAEVVVWDLEGREKMSYVESHNDDVTQLSFHPTIPEFLLSGSTDGLINIYNMKITEEDDALHQVINHGSVHRAGFINSQAIYGLSHDESLSVYKLADSNEEVEEPSPVVFGDVREKLGCEYAIDMLLRGGESEGTGILAVGSHTGGWVDLQSLNVGGTDGVWALGGEDAVRLVGGHGEEIVRCLYLDDASATVFTGGEDGLVKAWRAS